MKILSIKYLIFGSLLFLLTGCYYDYLILSPDYSSGVYTNHGTIIFYYSLFAGHPPKGISRFPDGGIHKAVYSNFSLYEFDTIHKKINKIYDFGKMTSSGWHAHLSLENNILLFNIIPISWRQWVTEPDTVTTKYNNPRVGFYLYDLKSKELKKLPFNGYDPTLSPDLQQIVYKKRAGDSVSIWNLQLKTCENKQIVLVDTLSVFSPLFWINNNQPGIRIRNKQYTIDLNNGNINPVQKEIDYDKNKATATEINNLTHELSFKEWGFELSKHYPGNKRQYIADIVLLNGNLNFRKAIIEELAKDLTITELENIIETMDHYAESLSEFEKTPYIFSSKKTKELLIHEIKEKIRNYEY